MEVFSIIFEFIVTFLIFGILFAAGEFIYKKLSNSNSRLLNPEEYMPEEELETLRQVYYLIIMLILFVFILYILVSQGKDLTPIAILQIVLSVYIAITLDYSNWKNKILFFLLVPYETIGFFVFNDTFIMWPMYIVHVFVYMYFIKVYFDKFRTYTETNRLGITIILLFAIIFISFINTILVESVEPLDAIVMVSNAFTSNGYAILGTTGMGKVNSILLVWGGYIISGVGTATLTAAMLLNHNKKREKELDKRLDELESLIKDNK